MKDLLYLKDEQIKEFIQLLYYAYRETFSDPKEVLSKKYFGPAHLRALNLIERNPGINLGELIFKLKVLIRYKAISDLTLLCFSIYGTALNSFKSGFRSGRLFSRKLAFRGRKNNFP